jgi:hypothetical protein
MIALPGKRILRATAAAVLALSLAACGQVYSRTDFKTMVIDKSEEEVTKNVGKPKAVDASKPDHVVWKYSTATFDTDQQNRRDSETRVIFEKTGPGGKLKATNVEFG